MKTRLGTLLFVFTVLALAVPGCGPSTSERGASEGPDLRTLSENRALTLVTELLSQEGIPRGPLWTVQLDHEASLEVDVRLGQTQFGVEWISPQDRVDHGDALPGPTDDGRLRIVPGAGDSSGAQVLLLEHTSYGYANEREHVQSGVVSASEAESRLRRDLRDFLHYVRGQGGI